MQNNSDNNVDVNNDGTNDAKLPETIICHRYVNNILSYRIKWKNYPDEYNEWVPESKLIKHNNVINDYWEYIQQKDNVEKSTTTDLAESTNCNPHNDIMIGMKKMSIEENDNDDYEIDEIENILEKEYHDGKYFYKIKWVGKKTLTWIEESDFIEKDALNDFNTCEKNRNDPTTKKRTWIYIRTSRRNNYVDEISLADQEQQCIDFSAANEFTIVGIYRDNGVSAKNMEKLFGLNQILEKIGKNECILVYDVTRFSRNMGQAIDILEHLRNNKHAVVHSVHDNVTWNNNATNRHIFRQLLSTSQLLSDTVSEKVKSSIKFKRTRGDHVGYTPYGYKISIVDGRKKLVKNPTEIDVICKIFEINNNLCNDIKSKGHYTKIANSINKTYRNRRNKKFTPRFVKKLMTVWKDII